MFIRLQGMLRLCYDIPMHKLTAITLLILALLLPVGTARAAEASFPYERTLAAWEVSQHTDYTYSEVLTAWKGAPLANQVAVVTAVQQLDADYVYASSDPNVGFDCSGLVHYAWDSAGVSLPRTSGKQIKDTYEAPMHPGDLVWYPGHIMMWLGVGDYVIHAANRRLDVTISEVSRVERVGSVLPAKPLVGTTRAF